MNEKPSGRRMMCEEQKGVSNRTVPEWRRKEKKP
jgi:hypothetical protein